jgi:hypothetical protein
MYIDGMLIQAALLVNGVSIVQEERLAEVTYIHLEFDTHEVTVAEEAWSEVVVDDDSRARSRNWRAFMRRLSMLARSWRPCGSVCRRVLK